MNEPTVNDLLKELTRCGYYLINGCDGCRYNSVGTTQACNMKVMHQAANLSEQLTQKVEYLENDLMNSEMNLTIETERADAAIADLKENGFCNSCTGCNSPHVDPTKITYCYDWAWRDHDKCAIS